MEKETTFGGRLISLVRKTYSSLKLKNVFFIVSICLFVLFSFVRVLNHIPWYDEVLAFNIAHDLNLIEMFKLTKYEGHLCLWYLTIMPFAKLGVSYAFTLKLLSFSTILASILIMWKYTPFNDIEKTFLTFSSYLMLYSVYSRCYCLSILLLFALCALYPKRLKHPYFYSILLILCANTSVMALFGVAFFGLSFLHDIFKAYKDEILTRKNIAVMLTMFVLCGIFVLLQLVNFAHKPDEITWIQDTDLVRNFFDALFYADFSIYYINQLAYLILLAMFPFLCRKNLGLLLIVYGATASLFCVFMFVYPPQAWHLPFLFIYLVLGVWLFKYGDKDYSLIQKTVLVIFVIALWLNTLMPVTIKNGTHNLLAKYMLENRQTYENSRLYYFNAASYIQEILPHFYGTNIKFNDTMGYPSDSYIHYKEQAYLPFTALNPAEIFDKNDGKDAYIFMDAKVMILFSKALQEQGRGATLDKIGEIGPTYIFKVVK